MGDIVNREIKSETPPRQPAADEWSGAQPKIFKSNNVAVRFRDVHINEMGLGSLTLFVTTSSAILPTLFFMAT